LSTLRNSSTRQLSRNPLGKTVGKERNIIYQKESIMPIDLFQINVFPFKENGQKIIFEGFEIDCSGVGDVAKRAIIKEISTGKILYDHTNFHKSALESVINKLCVKN
jgi:hypothetical protein